MISQTQWPEQFWITGTDTDIGKSLVSALLTLTLEAGYFKPIQSGLQEATDTETIQRLTGLGDAHFYPESYRLNQPLSPHASAKIDGVEIRLDQIQIPKQSQKHLVIEGAGGLLVPLNQDALLIDLIAESKRPVLLVARSGLGTINHTLLSLEALRKREIPILGVVLSGPLNQGNKDAIEEYGKVKVLFEVDQIQEITTTKLKELTKSLKLS